MTHEDKYLKCKFPGQKDGEQIKLLIRKHWIIDVKIGAFFMVFALLPVFATILAGILTWPIEFNDTALFTTLATFTFFLFMTLITYIKWLNEELDIIIITNERVLAHDQVSLFHRQISETNISLVQDVKGVEKGIFGDLLHYGSMDIQTAAEKTVFNIKHVGDPYQSSRLILDIRDRYMDKEKFEKNPETGAPSPVYNL
jgi:hypothetical protein